MCCESSRKGGSVSVEITRIQSVMWPVPFRWQDTKHSSQPATWPFLTLSLLCGLWIISCSMVPDSQSANPSVPTSFRVRAVAYMKPESHEKLSKSLPTKCQTRCRDEKSNTAFALIVVLSTCLESSRAGAIPSPCNCFGTEN